MEQVRKKATTDQIVRAPGGPAPWWDKSDVLYCAMNLLCAMLRNGQPSPTVDVVIVEAVTMACKLVREVDLVQLPPPLPIPIVVDPLSIPIVVDPDMPGDTVLAVDQGKVVGAITNVGRPEKPGRRSPGAVACIGCGEKVTTTRHGLCDACRSGLSRCVRCGSDVKATLLVAGVCTRCRGPEGPPAHGRKRSAFVRWLEFADVGKLSQDTFTDALKAAFEAGRKAGGA